MRDRKGRPDPLQVRVSHSGAIFLRSERSLSVSSLGMVSPSLMSFVNKARVCRDGAEYFAFLRRKTQKLGDLGESFIIIQIEGFFTTI